jgi:hypothetical protein
MRPLKFRAWDNGAKQWLMGYESPNLGGFSLFGELMLLGEWSSLLNEFLFDRNGHKADDLIVMQFTGLLDKNGNDIYEGDILRITCRAPYDGPPFLRKVSFQALAPACGFILGDADHDYIEHFGRIMKDDDTDWIVEVIGNVHQNPDLLESKVVEPTNV